jgi:hypothetical protein
MWPVVCILSVFQIIRSRLIAWGLQDEWTLHECMHCIGLSLSFSRSRSSALSLLVLTNAQTPKHQRKRYTPDQCPLYVCPTNIGAAHLAILETFSSDWFSDCLASGELTLLASISLTVSNALYPS